MLSTKFGLGRKAVLWNTAKLLVLASTTIVSYQSAVVQLKSSRWYGHEVTQSCWHQDFAYFPHTNTDLVAVMVLLDDSTPSNGCMQVVRGSHKLGLLNHMQDGFFTGMCQESQYWDDELQIAQVTPKT